MEKETEEMFMNMFRELEEKIYALREELAEERELRQIAQSEIFNLLKENQC